MKRLSWLLALSLLVLTILACGQSDVPSPTAQVAPTGTPVSPTSESEEATLEPTEPPAEETVAPTESSTGEAPSPTSTPEPTRPTPEGSEGPPEILSFTAEPMSIVQGEEVTFSWEATGGTEAVIQWQNRSAMLEGISVDPNGGTETLVPQTYSPIGDSFTLRVENSAGSDSETIELDVTCAHDWVPALADNPPCEGCPSEAVYGLAAQEPFENGFMIWWGPEEVIYVFYDGGQYQRFDDAFEEGDPESDPDIVPPEGLYQPIRGFGLVWRSNPEVREALGWATAPEIGFETWRQDCSGWAMHAGIMLIEGFGGRIYQLGATGSTWQFYVR